MDSKGRFSPTLASPRRYCELLKYPIDLYIEDLNDFLTNYYLFMYFLDCILCDFFFGESQQRRNINYIYFF